MYLGLAKRRQRRKARKAAKARPSQAVAAAQFQKRHEDGDSKMPGARAVSEDTLNKKQGQYLQIPSGTNLFDMRDGKLMSKGSLAEGRYKLEMNKHSDNRMPKETTRIYKVKEWKSEKIRVNAKLEESETREDCTKIRHQQNQIKSLNNQISSIHRI